MHMTPIDVIAANLIARDPEAFALAKAAAEALTDERIVAAGVQALIDDGWRHGHEGPLGMSEQSDEDLANIARTVLRSVGA